MAEEGFVQSPNVLLERHAPVTGTFYEWVIAAPGHRVLTPVSTTMGVAGGFVLAFPAGFLLGMLTGSGWLFVAALLAGPFVGAGYAKVINRLIGTDRLVAKGKAIRLPKTERNDLVVSAAKRNARGYFAAAQRAAELDALEAALDGNKLTSAERTVAFEELREGTEELRLMLSQSALRHAAALLDPSDAAIRAAGRVTAAMYEELQEGKAASYDEDS